MSALFFHLTQGDPPGRTQARSLPMTGQQAHAGRHKKARRALEPTGLVAGLALHGAQGCNRLGVLFIYIGPT
jgi:hypothetical protein